MLPILSPAEAFARIAGKPRHQVRCLRVGEHGRFGETMVNGELVLVDLLGADVPHFVAAVYRGGWCEPLYRGTDPRAARALVRRVSAAHHIPVRRRKEAPRPTGGGALHLH